MTRLPALLFVVVLGASSAACSSSPQPSGSAADGSADADTSDAWDAACGSDCAGSCDGGPCLTKIFEGSGGPFGIAVDRTSVYVANQALGRVTKVGLDGTAAVTLASGQGGPYGIAVGGASVYWTNVDVGTSNGGSVTAEPVGGGALETLATHQAMDATRIAVDTASLYWADWFGGSVMKVSLGAGAPTTLASRPADNNPGDVTLDAENVYWVEREGGNVMKIAKSGGAPTVLASRQTRPSGIAVDDTSVYWVNAEGPDFGPGALLKVAIGGGAVVTLASHRMGPTSVAVDATSVYWAEDGTCMFDGGVSTCTGAVLKMGKEGGSPSTLASEQDTPSFVTLAGDSIYWATSSADALCGGGMSASVMRLTPR